MRYRPRRPLHRSTFHTEPSTPLRPHTAPPPQILHHLHQAPIVNEPGYDERQSSSTASFEYNAKLRLQTMRHAMTHQLTHPPAGFEDVVAKHFAVQRDRILSECRQWTLEAPAELSAKMIAALTALHAALPASSSAATAGPSPADLGELPPPPALPVEAADYGSSDDELYHPKDDFDAIYD